MLIVSNLVRLWQPTKKTYPIHVLCSCFGCKHGQDPSPAPDVQHYFVLEDVLVVVHGVPVGECPHFVLQHLLVKHITNHIRKVLTQLGPAESVNLFCWIKNTGQRDPGLAAVSGAVQWQTVHRPHLIWLQPAGALRFYIQTHSCCSHINPLSPEAEPVCFSFLTLSLLHAWEGEIFRNQKKKNPKHTWPTFQIYDISQVSQKWFFF